MHWAWQQGVAGYDWQKVRENAANIGTIAHGLILSELTDEPFDLDDYTPNEVNAAQFPLEKFRDWHSKHELTPILMETPLVSEECGFGGTPDCYGIVDGIPTLLDFKTSGAVYEENFYQLSAYVHLLAEHGHQVDETYILRIGKTPDEGFEYRRGGNLTNHFEVFEHCLDIYRLKAKIRKGGLD